MLVLGISGGIDLIYQNRSYLVPSTELHDSAAALVKDGEILAAIEEERLTRIKHTNKGPVSAIRYCLDKHKVRLKNIDKLVVAGDEEILAKYLRYRDLPHIEMAPVATPKGLVRQLLIDGLDEDISDEKIFFVPHHFSHALSAYAVSGFDKSLILIMDGGGDASSGLVANIPGKSFDLLRHFPIRKSLGIFYLNVIQYLGYRLFDEYKVMGLAPYGDPSKYRSLFRKYYELLPNGDYSIKIDLPDDLSILGPPRKKKDPITQIHKDIAAALQEALENIVFHLATHFRKETGQKNLCLAGGVAHNCTLNGKLLYSGIFEDIFVQPAAHDGGLALGAAFYPFLNGYADRTIKNKRLDHVYFGTDIEDGESIKREISQWSEHLDYKHMNNVSGETAKLLADGNVIGWVQGQSEFGPRALGNRSIVADPRPAENKNIINEMVKKREGYRPFAPSVMEEFADEYFELPTGKRTYDFMTFVVKVKKDKQAVLGATTHVDGSSRIQTVSRMTNRRYWELINDFREITGVPVILNTSFNNNVEPIVDSVEDAIVSFLTTKLHYLVVGEYLVWKKQNSISCYKSLSPKLPLYSQLISTQYYETFDRMTAKYEVASTIDSRHNTKISPLAYEILRHADGDKTLKDLMEETKITGSEAEIELLEEMNELWALRVIKLTPRPGK
jgi:carbamoyltransferase